AALPSCTCTPCRSVVGRLSVLAVPASSNAVLFLSAGARLGTSPVREGADWRDPEIKDEPCGVEHGDDPPGREVANEKQQPGIDAEQYGVEHGDDPADVRDEQLGLVVTGSYSLRGRREEDSEDLARALEVFADTVHPQHPPRVNLASNADDSDVLSDGAVKAHHGRIDETNSGESSKSPRNRRAIKGVSRRHLVASPKGKYRGSTFISKSQLGTHVRKHTHERPFKCETCEQSFKKKENLKVHVRTHTGEKPYQCEICQKRFSLRQNLITHIRTHTGEKPFRCDFCKQRFADRSALVQHIRTHTGEKPYKCDQCEKCFAHSSHRGRHVRTQHTKNRTVD
ncbi:zinc finger protein 32-like, partial [Frankliniella occidentalis]